MVDRGPLVRARTVYRLRPCTADMFEEALLLRSHVCFQSFPTDTAGREPLCCFSHFQIFRSTEIGKANGLSSPDTPLPLKGTRDRVPLWSQEAHVMMAGWDLGGFGPTRHVCSRVLHTCRGPPMLRSH